MLGQGGWNVLKHRPNEYPHFLTGCDYIFSVASSYHLDSVLMRIDRPKEFAVNGVQLDRDIELGG